MGLEIRKVPAGWEHPRQRCEHSPWAGGCDEAKRHGGWCLKPLLDRDFEAEAREWVAACATWDAGTHPDLLGDDPVKKSEYPFYWQRSGNPPDAESYRPKWTTEPTHVQVYETVSEGTPVTPHFATREELVAHLVAHGTSWDASGWTRANAESFVGRGFAVSLIIADGVVYRPRDGMPSSSIQEAT